MKNKILGILFLLIALFCSFAIIEFVFFAFNDIYLASVFVPGKIVLYLAKISVAILCYIVSFMYLKNIDVNKKHPALLLICVVMFLFLLLSFCFGYLEFFSIILN